MGIVEVAQGHITTSRDFIRYFGKHAFRVSWWRCTNPEECPFRGMNGTYRRDFHHFSRMIRGMHFGVWWW